MSTLNVASIVSAWVEDALDLTFKIYNDMIPDTTANAACLRYDPAPAAERRFQDGTRLLKWNLTFYIRNKDRSKAREYADLITKTLDGAIVHDNGSNVDINCEAATLPQFINVDEKNNTVYSAAIVCTYLEPRES